MTEMIFSHDSAVAYWRHFGSIHSAPPVHARSAGIPETFCSVDRAVRMARVFGIPAQEGVHVLASRRVASCGSISPLVCHASNIQYPPGSFVELSKGIYVDSPELSFVRMAKVLPVSAAIAYGCELCGTYAKAGLEAGFRARAAVTNARRLESYVERADGIAGVKAARYAVRHVVDGAASPMEAVVYLLLCLPWSKGGYSVPKPVMNARVVLGKSSCRYGGPFDFGKCGSRRGFVDDEALLPFGAQGAVNMERYRVCDLYWPEAHLAVEYDGLLYHASRERLGADAVRRNELETRGEMVVTVTIEQVRSLQRMEDVARQVLRRLGMRMRMEKSGSTSQRMLLRKTLLAF